MDPDTQKILADRFALLPPVVQRAITSADVEKHLRELANTHKLHIDQWDKLQNEVTLTLFGFQEPADLPRHLADALGVPADTASALAGAINLEIFEPIREELERGLSHPEAQAKETDEIERARQAALKMAQAAGERTSPAPATETPAPRVQPATPPAPKPEGTVVRAPVSETYKPAQSSTERKDVTSDPYREPPL